MLAAASSGEILFQFLDGNNNEATVSNFIIEMTTELDRILPEWRNSHVLLLDNCPSHKTPIVRKIIAGLRVPVLFSAPASYKSIPVELFFAALKGQDFE